MPVSKSFICMTCDAELPSLEALHEHEKIHSGGATVTHPQNDVEKTPKVETAVTPPQLTKAPWQAAAEEHKKEGVSLVYKYEGYCSKCGGAVETIKLENVLQDSKRLIVVCWCSACKAKISQRAVGVL